MSIQFSGFTGPSYQTTNKYASIERTVNWFLNANEEANTEAKYKLSLEPFPGNVAFCTLPVPGPFNQGNRGLLEYRGKVFGVNGPIAFSISSLGVFNNIGTVANDGKPVCMVANGNSQILLLSAGLGYVISTVPETIAQIVTADFLGGSYCTFQDGYGIVVSVTGSATTSNTFQISGTNATPVGDFSVWDASFISVQAGQGDFLRAVISSREYVRLFGDRRSQVYQDVGNSGIGGFPFQNYNQTFIETGIAAVFSLAEMGDSLMWIGNDARGVRACWRDRAFTPQRVSTFAVEQRWQQYPTVADAVAFPWLWKGHAFYQITFPTAGETWVYDATMSDLLGKPIWSERTYTDFNSLQQRRSEQFHCFAFGKHLVGSTGIDGNPGAIYQYGDTGTRNMNPQLQLRWSNDAGNSFGSFNIIPVGVFAAWQQRVYWNRNGYARDRVYYVRYAEETECGTNNVSAQVQQPITRDRICPHVWKNNKRILYNRIEFECTRGVGSADGVTPAPFTFGLVGAELDLIEAAS